jgi:hypothetical protein
VVRRSTVATEAWEQAQRLVDRESTPIARLHEPLYAEFLRGGERICRGLEHVAASGIDPSGLIGPQLIPTPCASCIQLWHSRRCQHD